MKRNIVILLLLLFPFVGALQAQTDDTVAMASDDIVFAHNQDKLPLDFSRTTAAGNVWDFHLSLGSSIIGSSYSSASLFAVKPSFVYRPNDRLVVKGSVAAINSYSLSSGNYSLRGLEARNLAPLRNPSGAMAGMVNVSAAYKANDRLWIAASLMHVGGQLASAAIFNPWFCTDGYVNIDATAFTASMRYRLGDNNYIDFHMTVVNDRTGALGPLYFGAPYGSAIFYENALFGSHIQSYPFDFTPF
ncbi:MAG: hypothetical protein J6X86_05710 [Bacteroidales bacterium]|nr:hypothetical protein [Bacteroidales bacterium]